MPAGLPHNIFRLFLIVSMSLGFLGVALAQDPQEVVRRFELQQKDKIARVRHLVSNGDVRYNTSGELISKWTPGRWTWHSAVQIKEIELKNGILKIKARRILLNYSRAIHKFKPLLSGQGL